MTVLQTVGDRVRAARKHRGLDQKELGDRIGVHEKTVSRWENNKQPIELANLEALATVLRVDFDWLREGDRGEGVKVREPVVGRVHEGQVSFGTRRLPLAARTRLNEYANRLKEAGLGEDVIDYFERLIMDFTFAQYHVAGEGPKTEEDWVNEVDAGWAAVSHYLRQKGAKL